MHYQLLLLLLNNVVTTGLLERRDENEKGKDTWEKNLRKNEEKSNLF